MSVSQSPEKLACICWRPLHPSGTGRCPGVVLLACPRWERICNSTLCSFPEPCDLAGLLGGKRSCLLWVQCRWASLPAPEISLRRHRSLGAGWGGHWFPPTPAMEEQDHACDPSWEPPQPKSRPDSPWSWVRARAWPHANPPPPAWLRSADGPCGSCRGSVRPHLSKEVMGAAAPQRLLGWRLHLWKRV